MNVISKISLTVAAGLMVAVAPSAAPADSNVTPDDLACQTVADCYVVIDQLWPQLIDLNATVEDLRPMLAKEQRRADRAEAIAERRRERIERQTALIVELRKQAQSRR